MRERRRQPRSRLEKFTREMDIWAGGAFVILAAAFLALTISPWFLMLAVAGLFL